MPEMLPTALTPHQQGRVEAMTAAKNVLSNSQLFGRAALDSARGIEDLLILAEWILDDEPKRTPPFATLGSGGVVIPLTSTNLLSAMTEAAEKLPDCGNPNCPIHTPKREAENLDPEDAKSSFDPPLGEPMSGGVLHDGPSEDPESVALGTKKAVGGRMWETQEGKYGRVWYNLGPELADVEPKPRPPTTDPEIFSVGTWKAQDAVFWMVVRDTDGQTKIWKQIPAVPPNSPETHSHGVRTDSYGNEWIVKTDGHFGHKYWDTK